MTLSLILMRKIASLLLVLFSGYIIVKFKMLKASDSHTISVITLYLVCPCMIISAFEVDLTPDVVSGLLLAGIAGLVTQVLMVVITIFLSRFFHFTSVEKDSIIFSNCGNLIIPLVVAILGPEWVIYSCAYLSVQVILLWTYGKAVLCSERAPGIKEILTNVNMISIMIGIFLFVMGIRLPPLVQDAVDSLGSMVGPAAMLVTGMLIAGMDLSSVFKRPRLWLCVLFRLIIYPIIILVLLKYCGLGGLFPEGDTVLLITLLAAISPAASSITQMAQVYGNDAEYAGLINVVTLLLCVFTMPLFVYLYLM